MPEDGQNMAEICSIYYYT